MSKADAIFKIDMLRKLEVECYGCDKCKIGEEASELWDPHVFSNMNFKAKIIVIGQNPGFEEVKKRRPFMGDSGKNFNNSIIKFGLKRSMFYITNSCKCFTPNNRQPSKTELENCRYFLEEEIKLIKPLLIVTLGNFGLKTICNISGVMSYHGEIIYSDEFKVDVFPIIHPSPINLNKPGKKSIFNKDMKILSEIIKNF